MPVKAKAKIEKGELKAKVKYPLVGNAEIELGLNNKLNALIKVPFLLKAKFSALLKLKKGRKND